MGGTADAAVEANSGILDVNDLDENDTNELFSYYASKFEEETEVDAKNRKSVDPLAADPALSDMKPIGSSANGQPVVDDGRGNLLHHVFRHITDTATLHRMVCSCRQWQRLLDRAGRAQALWRNAWSMRGGGELVTRCL